MEKKIKTNKNKLPKQIKVTVEWTDETFDFVEFVQMVLNFRKNKEKENIKYPIKEEKIY